MSTEALREMVKEWRKIARRVREAANPFDEDYDIDRAVARTYDACGSKLERYLDSAVEKGDERE